MDLPAGSAEIDLNAVCEFVESRPVQQQPDWDDLEAEVAVRRDELTRRPAVVTEAQIRSLRADLEAVARGEVLVVQAGDCAEDPVECDAASVAAKAELVRSLGVELSRIDGRPVVHVGRIAGQFCKPRSKPVEEVDGLTLPSFRGHIVNRPEPAPEARRPDPTGLLRCHESALSIARHLGWGSDTVERIDGPAPVWTSHEALLLDYALGLLRTAASGGAYLGSTHWPWIGERTRALYSAHVALLGSVINPVACKVGPTATPDEVVALCAALDPDRQPGRLTLIARLGSEAGYLLPELVRSVRAAGFPVLWLCDPMHGNTFVGPTGHKTRLISELVGEVEAFCECVDAAGGLPAGLHLETTPADVLECVSGEEELFALGADYRTLCDPRLNRYQALEVVSGWVRRATEVAA